MTFIAVVGRAGHLPAEEAIGAASRGDGWRSFAIAVEVRAPPPRP
jgi:hypothetical protein